MTTDIHGPIASGTASAQTTIASRPDEGMNDIVQRSHRERRLDIRHRCHSQGGLTKVRESAPRASTPMRYVQSGGGSVTGR